MRDGRLSLLYVSQKDIGQIDTANPTHHAVNRRDENNDSSHPQQRDTDLRDHYPHKEIALRSVYGSKFLFPAYGYHVKSL